MNKFLSALKRIHWSLKVLILAVLVSAFTVSPSDKDFFEISKNLDVFTSLFRELNIYYVDNTDPGDLMKTGIDAMLASLDPYTNYYPESDIEDYRFMTTGAYGGIGSTIRRKDDYVIISEPYEGFPAHQSGLKAGDVILEVDGNEVKGKNTEELSSLLKGQPGTEVNLKIQRPGKEELMEVKLTRQEIKISSVPYYGMMNDSIGYISLRSFTNTAAREVKTALLELKEEKGMKKLVFDLRGNPGGLLRESIKIVNFFVDKGQTVVSTKGKIKDWDKEYKALDKPVDLDMPIVVLIDDNSASASEIVSGSLQDLDRAVVVGQKSFGKGLVQTTRPLSYNTKLKLTTAKYYTPSGRCIQAIDYSNKDENGKATKVPDSLHAVFKTVGGRKVLDGEGITPDVEVESKYLSKISVGLIQKHHIFDFATEYVLAHDSIPAAKDFKLGEEGWSKFKTYMSEHTFDFETSTDKALTKFEKYIEEDGYTEDFQKDIEALKEKLAHAKEDDFNDHKAEIIRMLEQEIVTRYYYQNGQIEYNLRDDEELEVAIEILSDVSRYDSILAPVQ